MYLPPNGPAESLLPKLKAGLIGGCPSTCDRLGSVFDGAKKRSSVNGKSGEGGAGDDEDENRCSSDWRCFRGSRGDGEDPGDSPSCDEYHLPPMRGARNEDDGTEEEASNPLDPLMSPVRNIMCALCVGVYANTCAVMSLVTTSSSCDFCDAGHSPHPSDPRHAFRHARISS